MATRRQFNFLWGTACGFCLLLGFIAGYQIRGDAPEDVAVTDPNLARCTHVLDGDTIKIDWQGVEETVRILGIDTMETRSIRRLEKQSKQLGIPEDDLKKIGKIAKRTTENWLLDQPVRLVFPSQVAERDAFGRLLAYIEQQGVDIGERLLLGGLACTAPWEHERMEAYRLFEEEARRMQKGIWRNAPRADR